MNTRIHIHTKYSLLDAIIDPEQLVKGMAERGEKALCVTEHGNVYSNVEIYKLCKRYGIKYMYGCEMYICGNVNVRDASSKYHHLVVIAKNETGRINLNKLVSLSCHYKYYGKPRIDFPMLERHKDGLIVLSACMAGEVQRSLLGGDYQETLAVIKRYKDTFGDDYYLEYQSHSEPTQQKLNRVIVALAKKLGIRYVVTTDAHYLNKDDQKYHSIFVQIGQAREVGETYNDCYIQTDEEVLSICQSTTREDNLTAIATLDEIADKCDVHLPLSAPIMPHEPVPAPYRSEIEYLQHLCVEGWKEKQINKKPNRQVYLDRLVYEMNAIQEMGFEGYFLFVRSYVNHVKRRGIGRGSGGGSLVNYLTHITDIDPIEYGLYFERFIDVGALQLLKEGKIAKSELKIPDYHLVVYTSNGVNHQAENCWKTLKATKLQHSDEISASVNVAKAEKIGCMAYGEIKAHVLRPKCFNNGKSAAALQTEEGSTTMYCLFVFVDKDIVYPRRKYRETEGTRG